jgi:hypothetical protein
LPQQTKEEEKIEVIGFVFVLFSPDARKGEEEVQQGKEAHAHVREWTDRNFFSSRETKNRKANKKKL